MPGHAVARGRCSQRHDSTFHWHAWSRSLHDQGFDYLYDLTQLLDKRRVVPTAVLSRQTAGLRNKSLIINLPGKPKAIRETIDEVRSPNNCNHCVHALYVLRLHAARSTEPI